jgi:hypothetical protein
MKRSEVQAWLDEQGIDCRTISLAVPVDDDGHTAMGAAAEGDAEPWFGQCEISGDKGNVYRCTAATKDGDLVDFDAGEWLISGHLGRIAGAF